GQFGFSGDCGSRCKERYWGSSLEQSLPGRTLFGLCLCTASRI
ncbi:uncharacterized protein METZ01_LOCUS194999, partial [marine metagenome]